MENVQPKLRFRVNSEGFRQSETKFDNIRNSQKIYFFFSIYTMFTILLLPETETEKYIGLNQGLS